jgi:hypothetical protein
MGLENLPADVREKLASLGFNGGMGGAPLPVTTGKGPPGGNPTELFRKLMEMPRPSTVVDFPRRNPDGTPVGQFAMTILSESELNEVRAAADRTAKKMLGDAQKEGEQNLGYQDIYRNVSVVELLWRACRASKEEMHIPAFLSPALMRKNLTTDELAVLMDAYLQFKVEAGPIISDMSEAEMDAWIKRLAEGAGRVPLSLLSSEAKTDLLLRSVALLRSCWTGSGSAGSPAGSSSTEGASPGEDAPASPELNANEVPKAAEEA